MHARTANTLHNNQVDGLAGKVYWDVCTHSGVKMRNSLKKKKKKQIQQDESGARTIAPVHLMLWLSNWTSDVIDIMSWASYLSTYTAECPWVSTIPNNLYIQHKERQQRLPLLCLCMNSWTQEEWERFLPNNTHRIFRLSPPSIHE